MLRSLLVGLDGSACSRAAVELGLDWAQRAGALLVGLAIIDEPTIAAAVPRLLGAPSYAEPIVYGERMADAKRHAEQFLEQFEPRCAEAGVASKTLEDIGFPSEQIVLEAQRYDLVLLGQKTRFHFEIHERHDDTLTNVLKSCPRPVVVVPEAVADGRAVVVAYDGSLQAARALFAFRDLGLDLCLVVHVVTVHPELEEATRRAERAAEFLRSHELRVDVHCLASRQDPAEAILAALPSLGAGLLVMGAYGQPTLREFFLGSTTRTLLKQSPVPLFLFH
jgi:nucleotide-binding universal stress UspA family protein